MNMNMRSGVLVGIVPLLALPCPPVLAQLGKAEAVQGIAVIEKPQGQSFDTGACIRVTDGSLMGTWNNRDGAFLTFTIGPFRSGAPVDAIPQSSVKYTGPGTYKDVLVKYSLRNAIGFAVGLGTITVGPDGQHGRFELNNGKVAGSWDCGRSAEARNKTASEQAEQLQLTASSSGPFWDKSLFDMASSGRTAPHVMRMAQHIRDLDRAGATYLSCQYGPPEGGARPVYFWKDRVMVSAADAAAISRYHRLLVLGDRAFRQCPATFGEAMREQQRIQTETQAIIKRLYPSRR